jgi:CDP-glucose 4,6-dehydratase
METMVSTAFINPDPQFWRGRRVALTGHTGFKGSWMALLLKSLGANVSGYALVAQTEPNLFSAAKIDSVLNNQIGDVRDQQAFTKWLQTHQPEVVFHFAAQALVRQSYTTPVDTFTTNVNGTLHLLEAIRQTPSVKSVVIVTTDKVYRNFETGRSFVENDPLGGHDPYSASKAACELVVSCYRASFLQHIGVATARAGNVIGGGDWSSDRLLPDAIKAWQENRVLEIRNPEAIRPWQHVLEPLNAYVVLAQQLFSDPQLGLAYNIGPNEIDAVSVRKVIDLALQHFGEGEVQYAQYAQSHSGPHEAKLLHLDVKLIEEKLGIVPRWNLETAVEKTVDWYRQQLSGISAGQLCKQDIESYYQTSINM